MDRDTRTSIAIREGRQLSQRLVRQLMIGQIAMVIILSVMDYFDASIKSLLIAGIFLGVGTIGNLIEQVAIRLDAGRAYMEMWANDTDESIENIWNRLGELRSPPYSTPYPTYDP